MKEFVAQSGGRYTYTDDIVNLQELALAITHMFDGCGNFILSGCNVSGSSIAPGYVYIDGKIRKFHGGSASRFPAYIVAKDSSENVGYKDFGDKQGRKIYEAAMGYSSSGGITIDEGGKAPRVGDAFIGKYALMIDSAKEQPVKENVIFEKQVTVKELASQKNTIGQVETDHMVSSFDENKNMVIQILEADNILYKMVFDKTSKEFRFFIGDKAIYTVSENGIDIKGTLKLTDAALGKIKVADNNVYEYDTASDDGVLNLNMIGHNGGKMYYRNLVVGDGKGFPILSVIGKEHHVQADGTVSVASSGTYLLTLKNTALTKDQITLVNALQWTDKNDSQLGTLGYMNSGNTDLYIQNKIGEITLEPKNQVNIVGKLKINNSDINEMFVKVEDFAKESKSFVKNTDPISVFVDQAGGGVAGEKAACNMLGAVHTSDAEKFITDTGWIGFSGQGVTGQARQYGPVVTVCGVAVGPGMGGGQCAFALPSKINPPMSVVHQVCGTKGEFVTLDGAKGVALAGSQFSVTYISGASSVH